MPCNGGWHLPRTKTGSKTGWKHCGAVKTNIGKKRRNANFGYVKSRIGGNRCFVNFRKPRNGQRKRLLESATGTLWDNRFD
jgi:hypothetical protein